MRAPATPIRITMQTLDGKWKPLILWSLRSGQRRFGELRAELVAISPKVLATALRELEKDGVLRREVFAEVPPHVEYSLTDLGRSLTPIIEAMHRWGLEHALELDGKRDRTRSHGSWSRSGRAPDTPRQSTKAPTSTVRSELARASHDDHEPKEPEPQDDSVDWL